MVVAGLVVVAAGWSEATPGDWMPAVLFVAAGALCLLLGGANLIKPTQLRLDKRGFTMIPPLGRRTTQPWKTCSWFEPYTLWGNAR